MLELFSLHRFKQSNKAQFLKDVANTCTTYDLVTLQLEIPVEALKDQIALIDASFQQALGSTKTQDLKDHDENRGNYYRCIQGVASASVWSANAEKVAAASLLLGILQKYGSNVIRRNYQEETHILENLSEDLLNQADALNALQVLGLEEDAVAMRQTNTNFNTLWIQRNKDIAISEQIPPVSVILPNAIEAYKTLVNHINAHLMLNATENLKLLIAELETVGDKYSLLQRDTSQISNDEIS